LGRYQLYQSDPSGNYGGWKATAIGANQQAAQNILKQEYKDDISLADAVKLVVQVQSVSLFPPRHVMLKRAAPVQRMTHVFAAIGWSRAASVVLVLELRARSHVHYELQVLAKTLDSTALTTDKLEVSTITRDDKLGRVWLHLAPSMHALIV